MNPLDYASLEASKRLIEARIVVPSEFYWEDHSGEGKWEIHNIVLIRNCWGDPVANGRFYPAPSMAGVWREFTKKYSAQQFANLIRERFQPVNEKGMIFYFYFVVTDVNNLIDLLIGVRKEVSDATV